MSFPKKLRQISLDFARSLWARLLIRIEARVAPILAPHAIAMMADAINQHAEADIFYSDQDKLDPSGQRYDPWFKPD
jgi:hypothetical protein